MQILRLTNNIRQKGLYDDQCHLKEEELRIREIDLRDAVFFAITLAQAEISKIRVGAPVLLLIVKEIHQYFLVVISRYLSAVLSMQKM